MLEIKNVTKIYKVKGGVETKALDNVSISFGETGLVFLLGKSGSGKSTLLNVCGGLDEPTSGEVIVKGKSSKDFSGSDFDSYRNTFVGFIFQEYNVLDEFNVEDNIALALELQGKPKDKQKIAELLKEVELESFAKRKPNTLSGGQKQRIAIARALIKEPQIIMADEPTGALDSATGKQVFDTLKKLSKTRLVIVVSHDREFAEIYGDRIVELKDGKIISDVTKAEVPPESLDENVTIIGGKTLSIKSGSKLTSSNIKAIQDFVLSSEGDVIITKGEKEISTFRKATRMTDVGATETFNDTVAEDVVLKEYSREDSRFIRSRLPAGKAIKIGASGLKLKPIRLIFTILLSFIAFTMFGLFSTLMLYDGNKVAVNSFMNSDYEYLNLEKYYTIKETWTNFNGTWEGEYSSPTFFTQQEIDDFAKTYGSSTFGYYTSGGSLELDNVKVRNGKTDYYSNGIGKIAYLPEGHAIRSGLTGTYPAAPDEICISSYMLDVMNNEVSEVNKATVDKEGKVTYEGENLNVNSAQDIINNYIVITFNGNRVPFKVTGVFDCGAVSSKYDSLKQSSTDGASWMLAYQYQNYLDEGLFKLALVSEDFYSTYESYFSNSFGETYVDYFTYSDNRLSYKHYEYNLDFETGEYAPTGTVNDYYMDNYVAAYGGENQLTSHFFGGATKTSLSGNEVVVNVNLLRDVLDAPLTQYYIEQIKEGNYLNDTLKNFPEPLTEDDISYWDENHEYGYYWHEALGINRDTYEDYLATYYQIYYNEVYHQVYNLCNEFSTNLQKYNTGGYYRDNEWDENGNLVAEGGYVTITAQERLQALNEIIEIVNKLEPIELELNIDDTRTVICKIVGFHEIDITSNNTDSAYGNYFSQDFIDTYLDVYKFIEDVQYETNYVEEEGAIYGGVFIAYDKSESSIKNVLAMIGKDNKLSNDVYYELQSSVYNSIEMANDFADTLSTVFLWVGVVFAVFSALLMFNFISVSISSKRKEIGILRAVGARGTDVFKIFFSEAGIITGICAVLAIIGAFVGSGILNSVLKTEIGLDVTLFVFGIASVGIMIAIALVVAFIATFLPVYFAARKKPVDSIRAL